MYAILENAEKTVLSMFVGIAIPHQPTLADDIYGPIRSEKILKFKRSALMKIAKRKKKKVDPRYKGGEDLMRYPVGKPGSPERVEALAMQYASLSAKEISPFMGD